MKTILAALVLTVAPAIAMAECSYGKQAQTATCADGSKWDASAGKCVTDPLG